MTVDFRGYQPFNPGVNQPLHELPRKEAKAAFERLMDAKGARIAELERLLQRNGLRLDDSPEGIARLNEWFRNEVEPDHRQADRLRPLWYGVVNDLALYLGDVIIDRAPNLNWAFFEKGARDVAFQRHVIMGFTKVANPNYNVDIDMRLASYGGRVISGEHVRLDEFQRWIDSALAWA